MSYGFEVRNALNQIVVNDKDFNLGLLSQGSVIGDSTVNTGILATETMPLVFWRTPSSRKRVLLKMDRVLSNSIYYWAPTFTVTDTSTSVNDAVPTIYYKIFVPMNLLSVPSGQEYGIVVKDANLKTTFDSRFEPAYIERVVTLSYPTWDANSATDPAGIYYSVSDIGPFTGLGTPWLASTDVYTAGTSKGVWYNGIQRYPFDTYYYNINNTISAGYVYTPFNIPYVSGALHWNNNSGATHVVFAMPGTSTPLTAWINQTAGVATNSCSYATGTCTTSDTLYTEWVGGNSTAVTHTWQLIGGNAASFTLSYPFANGVTVSLIAAAGTYTTTLRYTLSQAGSTSVIIDYPVERVHSVASAVSNPLTCQNTTSTHDQVNTAGVTLYMYANGTWEIQDENFTIIRSGNWYTPTTAGIGSSYSVFFTRDTGVGTATSTSWQSLGSTQSVSVFSSATTFDRTRSSTYTIEIKNNSTSAIVSISNGITLEAIARYTGTNDQSIP